MERSYYFLNAITKASWYCYSKMLLAGLGVMVLYLTLNEVEGFDLHRSARIRDGELANIQDFPFFAALSDCGAVILSDRWVATTANCVLHKPTSGSVLVGSETRNSSQVTTYDKVVIHPKLNNPYKTNNIALLRLSTPLQFTENIQPVDLPKDIINIDPLVFVSRGYDETGKLSSTIKKMEIQKLSSQQCLKRMPIQVQNSIRPYLYIYEKAFICGIRPDGQSGLCNQDFGSPLVQGKTLVGIASSNDSDGSLKCEPSKIGFYVNVLSYVPWIKSVTGIR